LDTPDIGSISDKPAILSTSCRKLDIPNFGVAECTHVDQNGNVDSALTRIASAHATFRATALHASSNAAEPFNATDAADGAPYDRPVVDGLSETRFADSLLAEANVINLFFPDIKDVAIRVAFTAWLAFACVTDDIGETLDMEDRRLALLESIEVLKGGKSILRHCRSWRKPPQGSFR
jgi:hypothetical protein